MGVGFITGRLCTNRLEKIFDLCFEEAKSDSMDPIYILVPEKYSYEVEKRFSERLLEDKDPNFRIRVVTFSSLANMVFSTVGGLCDVGLSKSARSMLVYKSINAASKDLKSFKGVSGVGFVNKMMDLIIEFKQNNMSCDDVLNMLDMVEDEELKCRLSDYARIYSEYDGSLVGKYIDVEDRLEMFSSFLKKYDGIKNSTIFITEFTGFTPVQYKIIESLILASKDVYFSLITDLVNFNARRGVFAKTNITFLNVNAICQKYGVKRIKDVSLSEDGYYANEYLRHLEKNINKIKVDSFDEDKDNESEIGSFDITNKTNESKAGNFDDKNVENKNIEGSLSKSMDINSAVLLGEASSIYSEVSFIANEINRLVRREGYRYSDITVCCRDLEMYSYLVDAIFGDHKIRYFIDSNISAKFNPMVSFVLSILKMKQQNYSYESVFRYLKTGFSNLSFDEVSILENFVLENGIKGKAWFEESWKYAVSHNIDEDGESDLSIINEIKNKMFTPIARLHDRLKGRNKIKDVCKYLYEFLMDIGLDQKAYDIVSQYEEEENFYKAAEYKQAYKIIMDVLDEMYNFLGDEYISLENFNGLLEVEFDSMEIGFVPPSRDEVKVTTADRMSTSNVKVLFFMGCLDGVFPANTSENSIISDNDREKLLKIGVKFDSDSTSRYYDEQYLVYKAMSTATTKLYLSYFSSNYDGKENIPSPIIKKIKQMFSELKVVSLYSYSEEVNVLDSYSKEGLFNYLEEYMRTDSGEFFSLYKDDVFRFFLEDEEYSVRTRMIDKAIGYTNKVSSLGELMANNIYGKSIFSVSKLEKFASCPFSYFINYGLRLKSKNRLEFSAMDSGIYNHKILDEFSKSVLQSGVKWMDLDRSFIEKEVASISSRLMMSRKSYILNNSKKYVHMAKRINDSLVDSIALMVEQIQRGSFIPSGFEVEFDLGEGINPIRYSLKNGREVTLVGKIDRVDICSDENADFVRLIDYKSSGLTLDMNKIYEGLQMQLFIYMRAILESKKRIDQVRTMKEDFNYKPAALLYSQFNISDVKMDDFSEYEYGDEDSVREKVLKENKFKGFLIKDKDIVKHLDKKVDSENKYSSIFQLELKKDGDIGSRTKGLDPEDFDVVNDFVLEKAKEISEKIYTGRIDISPFKYGDEVACRFCLYNSICQFDMTTGSNKYNMVKNVASGNKFDDVIFKMRQALKSKQKKESDDSEINE